MAQQAAAVKSAIPMQAVAEPLETDDKLKELTETKPESETNSDLPEKIKKSL